MRPFSNENGAGTSLANYISENKASDTSGPILWLGAGCSISAGCPSSKELLKRFSSVLDRRIRNYTDLAKQVTKEHQRLLTGRFITPTAPSRGYAYLAQLIARGYFDIILTTNWDPLLEHQLRLVLPPDRLMISTRCLENDEQISENLLKLPGSVVYLLRLHGDMRTELITEADRLLKFDASLEAEIERLFKQRGVIFVGYALEEHRIARILPSIERIWYVNPMPLQESIAETYKIDSQRCISGDDALFDNFIQGLCYQVLHDELDERMLMDKEGKVLEHSRRIADPRSTIDALLENVIADQRSDSLDDAEIRECIRHLLEEIRKIADQRQGKTCLIFADDPEAPGGREIRRVIEREGVLSAQVKGYDMLEARITSTRYKERELEKLVPNQELDQYNTLVIFDDIAFSGNTLKTLRQSLVRKSHAKRENFVAALLRIPVSVLSELENDKWNVVYNSKHSGIGFMCPWGFVRPRGPVLSENEVDNEQLARPYLGPLNVEAFREDPRIGYQCKPWGEVAVLSENDHYSTRILSVERGQRTSLHYHLLRDETFVVLDDRICICLWDRFIKLNKHQCLRIPAGVPHSLIALASNCRVVEVSSGYCDVEHDIFRIHDIYRRSPGKFGDEGLL